MRDFEGEAWTQDEAWKNDQRVTVDPRELGLKVIKSKAAANLSDVPGVIHRGDNSGYQAIGLAWQFADLEPCKIILLGYDMQSMNGRRHWFGDHPEGLSNSDCYSKFIRFYDSINVEGVEIINCSRNTALRCFPRMDIDECMAALSI